MWAITGGCHYSLACIGYKHNDCSACPLFSDKKVLKKIEKSFAYKKRLFVNLNVIAISDWMKKEAVKSNIFSAEQITRIYNSVDISIFYPRAMDLKEKYCINNDKPIVLAGAQNLSHIYKGGEIIAKLFKQYKHDVNFVFFGNGINTIVGNDVENHKNLGFVDEDTLAELYSISDLFLMLSTQEAFGKTVIESLACKTPVLTVSDTGPDELTKVLNCNLSILNNNTNIELLGIIEASKNFDFNEIQHNIEKLFSLRSIAKLHYEYYSNL
jgi:glycosyltransferase involved in cell wall biosynthesis